MHEFIYFQVYIKYFKENSLQYQQTIYDCVLVKPHISHLVLAVHINRAEYLHTELSFASLFSVVNYTIARLTIFSVLKAFGPIGVHIFPLCQA